MELTNGLNKRVVEIYRGGELVWEMPRCDLQDFAVHSNTSQITVSPFPKKRTTVKMEITELNYQTWQTEVIYSDTQISDKFGDIMFKNFPAIPRGTIIRFTVTNPNCRELITNVTVD